LALSPNNKTDKSIQNRYILLIMVILCVVCILLAYAGTNMGSPVRNVAGYFFTPLEDGIDSVGNWFYSRSTSFKAKEDLKRENEELRLQVESLEEELVLLREEEYELSKFQELYEVDNLYKDYEKTGANVIAKSSSAWFSSFTIDKGENDGIEVGMNVLASGGLCGIVSQTSKNFAIVTSIVDDGSNVSASVLTTGDNCIVSGNLSKMISNGSIEFSSLDDSENAVSVGDMLVVSNISNRYIPGLIIGYITEIDENANKLTKSGTVKPAVDFKHLTSVLVITTKKQIYD